MKLVKGSHSSKKKKKKKVSVADRREVHQMRFSVGGGMESQDVRTQMNCTNEFKQKRS